MKVELDGRKMTDRDATHDYLARVLQFPSHYGRNLDALYDLLTEVGQTLEIEISHVDEIKSQLGIYGSTLLQTFQEAENDNLSLTVTLG